MKGKLANYYFLNIDKLVESKMKVLIENPSFGAVMNFKEFELYFVLRTDSIYDSTRAKLPNLNVFKKQEFKKQKSGKYCPVWSPQFWNQMVL
jgi:hypothetical protein